MASKTEVMRHDSHDFRDWRRRNFAGVVSVVRSLIQTRHRPAYDVAGMIDVPISTIAITTFEPSTTAAV